MPRWQPELVSVVDRLVLEFATLPSRLSPGLSPGSVLRCAARCRAKLELEGVTGQQLPAALEGLTRATLQARVPRQRDGSDAWRGAAADDQATVTYVDCPDTWLSAVWSRRGQLLVVRICGELDLAGTPVMTRLSHAFAASSCTGLEVDLADLTFCDCGGLGHLLRLHAAATARGGGLRFVALSPAIRRLLTRTAATHQLDVPPWS